MEQKNIKIGKAYKIVGNNGGCSRTNRCKDCIPFIKGIVVTSLLDEDDEPNRTVSGDSLNGLRHCGFDPRDLILIPTNWRERYANK